MFLFFRIIYIYNISVIPEQLDFIVQTPLSVSPLFRSSVPRNSHLRDEDIITIVTHIKGNDVNSTRPFFNKGSLKIKTTVPLKGVFRYFYWIIFLKKVLNSRIFLQQKSASPFSRKYTQNYKFSPFQIVMIDQGTFWIRHACFNGGLLEIASTDNLVYFCFCLLVHCIDYINPIISLIVNKLFSNYKFFKN